MDQLEYARRLEERYARRIEDLLTPVWGAGRVRAQVSLDLDFTVIGETTSDGFVTITNGEDKLIHAKLSELKPIWQGGLAAWY